MENPRPVLSVKNVSMEFQVPLEGSSSLKEYLIKLFKGKNSSRTLKALENIWLDVYEGEILGIIGTNGSGKSTLLKIIAGAITPTRGRVVTEEEKIQLLTLGTGFDRELTARENVFLNGALLGYSRSFLKERYPDIVSFAELEGFMEQKVKNFSSGMVSRLGFAVAAVSEKPGILILDEILSVGDVFFKEKSTARIQELMKKGRAVLIVSHSTDTILRNCTRAVWIEKESKSLREAPGRSARLIWIMERNGEKKHEKEHLQISGKSCACNSQKVSGREKKCSYPRFQAPSDRKTFSMESGILFFRRKRARGGHWVSGKDKTSFS